MPSKLRPVSRGKKAIRLVSDKRRSTLRKGKCSKGQQKTATILSHMLKGADYEMEITWDWLITQDLVNMYADIYFPKYKLVVEYHGEQHYKFPNYWHKTKEQYLAGRRRDKLKKDLLSNHGIKFIEWKYSEPFTERRAVNKLEKVGISETKIRKPQPSSVKKQLKILPRTLAARSC
jgi:hypothetical protein